MLSVPRNSTQLFNSFLTGAATMTVLLHQSPLKLGAFLKSVARIRTSTLCFLRKPRYMTSLSTSTTGAGKSVAPLNPDKAIRTQRANEYPHEVWFFLACLIALVAVSRLLSFVCSKVSRHGSGLSSQDPEKSSSHSKAVVNFRNLPLALVNIFRVVAFRFTLDFGSYSLNLTEVVLTLMYMAALFTWTFINSEALS